MKSYVICNRSPVSMRYLDTVSRNEIFRVTGHDPELFYGADERFIQELERFPSMQWLNFASYKGPTVGTDLKPWSLTEKACWYSHFNLWRQLVDRNEFAWIFEHDVVIDAEWIPYPEELYENEHVVMFGAGIGSGEAYCAHPAMLQKWIKAAKEKPLIHQVDTWMYDWFKKHPEHIAIALEKTRQSTKYGTTIDH